MFLNLYNGLNNLSLKLDNLYNSYKRKGDIKN